MSSSRRFGSQCSSNEKGVKYFDQFLKHFLEPYNKRDKPIDDDIIFKRLQPFNCEMLVRPKTGVSEMSSAITKPLEAITKSSCDLLDKDSTASFAEKLAPLVNAISPLNAKNNAMPTPEDVKNTLKCFVWDDPELDEAMESTFVMASNMLTMSTHYLVARVLFRNPRRYAEKLAVVGGAGDEFKKNPCLKELKKYLTACCVPPATTEKKDEKRNAEAELDTSDEEPNRKRARKSKEKESDREKKLDSCEEEEPEEREKETVVKENRKKSKKSKK